LSRDGTILLAWGDGTYKFRLGWGELAEIQQASDAGPFVVLDRLNNGTCRLKDISEVIRWGLIGGGLTPFEASKLVETYVERRPPAESRLTASAILMAGCLGSPEENIEKKSGAPSQDSVLPISPTENSGSEPYTP
jgi:hypothetical protein